MMQGGEQSRISALLNSHSPSPKALNPNLFFLQGSSQSQTLILLLLSQNPSSSLASRLMATLDKPQTTLGLSRADCHPQG